MKLELEILRRIDPGGSLTESDLGWLPVEAAWAVAAESIVAEHN